jgi:hypothetical protein
MYEMQQLAATCAYYLRPELMDANPAYKVFVENALFESNLSHLRGIDDFLRLDHEPGDDGKSRCAGDVLAVDYFPAYEPQPLLTTRNDTR